MPRTRANPVKIQNNKHSQLTQNITQTVKKHDSQREMPLKRTEHNGNGINKYFSSDLAHCKKSASDENCSDGKDAQLTANSTEQSSARAVSKNCSSAEARTASPSCGISPPPSPKSVSSLSSETSGATLSDSSQSVTKKPSTEAVKDDGNGVSLHKVRNEQTDSSKECKAVVNTFPTPENTPNKDDETNDAVDACVTPVKTSQGSEKHSSQIVTVATKNLSGAICGDKQDVPKSNAGKDAKSTKKRNGKSVRKHEPQSTKLTDFFPVRKSGRKTGKEKMEEENLKIMKAIQTGQADGLEVRGVEGKGRGVFAAKCFRRGEFVVEYAGDLIDTAEAKVRDEKYSAEPDKYGCYMYYFQYKDKTYCVDATIESGKLGRLVNHSKTQANCCTKQFAIGDVPYLILVAARDVASGEELLYDYGDRSKSSIEAHPWLKS